MNFEWLMRLNQWMQANPQLFANMAPTGQTFMKGSLQPPGFSAGKTSASGGGMSGLEKFMNSPVGALATGGLGQLASGVAGLLRGETEGEKFTKFLRKNAEMELNRMPTGPNVGRYTGLIEKSLAPYRNQLANTASAGAGLSSPSAWAYMMREGQAPMQSSIADYLSQWEFNNPRVALLRGLGGYA